MEIKTYFFDTYALYELIRKNPAYARFTDASIVTGRLNVMELYYGLLIEHNEETAERYYAFFSSSSIDASDTLIKQAMKFKAVVRTKNTKSNLSYIDAIGYAAALQLGIKFLTGDKEFAHLDNVEFVKNHR